MGVMRTVSCAVYLLILTSTQHKPRNFEMKCISLVFPCTENIHLSSPHCLVSPSVPIEQNHIDHERQPGLCTNLSSTCTRFPFFFFPQSNTLLWGSSWIINVERLNAPYSGLRSCSERLPRSHSWMVGAGLENRSMTSIQ